MTIVGLKWDHRVVIHVLQRYWDSEKLTSKVKKKKIHCSICIILCNSRISMLCAGYCQVRKKLQLAASILILQHCKCQLPLNHLVAVTKLSAEQCEHHILFSILKKYKVALMYIPVSDYYLDFSQHRVMLLELTSQRAEMNH